MALAPEKGGASNEPVEAYLESIGKTRKELFADMKVMTGKNRKLARKKYRSAKLTKQILERKRKAENRNLRSQGLASLIRKKPKAKDSLPFIPRQEVKPKGKLLRNGVYSLDNIEIVVITKPRFPEDILEEHHQADILRLFECFCILSQKKPAINGTYYFGGVFILVCENKETFKTLETFVEKTKTLDDGTELIFGSSEVLSRYFLVNAWFPGELNDQECFLRKLTVQNPAFSVQDWILKSTRNKGNKVHCLFKIPEKSFKPLALTTFSICYNLEFIKTFLLVDLMHKGAHSTRRQPQSRGPSSFGESLQENPWTSYRKPKDALKSLY